MWGETCNRCRAKEEQHQEISAAIKAFSHSGLAGRLKCDSLRLSFFESWEHQTTHMFEPRNTQNTERFECHSPVA